jgi:hypothetical protein
MLILFPRRFRRHLTSLVVLLGLLTGPATAQSPFPDCTSRTETNATLLLPAPVSIVLDGTESTGPLYIAVFSERGECVGSAHWTGPSTSLTVWGHSPNRERTDTSNAALAPGDTLLVRLFDPTTETAYTPSNSRMAVSFSADEPYALTTPQYVPNGIYVLDQIRARQTLASREE